MSMYLGRIHVRASLLVNYGLLYWAFISGLHVINKWKMCSVEEYYALCTVRGTKGLDRATASKTLCLSF